MIDSVVTPILFVKAAEEIADSVIKNIVLPVLFVGFVIATVDSELDKIGG